MSQTNQYLSTGSEWNFELLDKYDKAIASIAEEYKLDTYPNQIEVISSEQMMDAYSMVGMPINYSHWSFGKKYIHTERNYKRGRMGLAYEIVINSNPCIAYLMEENTMPMQALVIAHACYGHNSFFKGNYLFKTWTNADAIIDYLLFAKRYIDECENRHGHQIVEETLDASHALMNYGVDRYKRPQKLSIQEEKQRQAKREEYLQTLVNDLWRTIPKNPKSEETQEQERHFPAEPEENLLYFLEKNAPLLEPWQREVLRIVRKIGQYFYPQRQTQVMNEGWATFWHYTIINELYDRKLVNDAFLLECLHSHTNVVFQPEFDSPYYSGINPYALGFNMFMDIKRICQEPSKEDKYWFPDIAGSNWLETLDYAMRNYKDESFIAQFLSPKMIRDFKLFSILDDDTDNELAVSAIHDDEGYQYIRQALSAQYNLGNIEPNIQVHKVNIRTDRAITLRHTQFNRKPLGETTEEVLKHIHYLWGFDVNLEIMSPDQAVLASFHCPPKPEESTAAQDTTS